MPLYISSLNSGSNGNCYYVGNEEEAVLIDAGLSCRETERRMNKLGLSMNKVKAIFISHEHTDHISGLQGISKKFRLPVYLSSLTFKNCTPSIEPALARFFEHPASITIGALRIDAFKKSHDAIDPYSFMVSGGGVNIGVITDIGYACDQVTYCFSRCDAAFLESNYCEEMLAEGNYPHHLKRRISGRQGHLSNSQALELFLKCRSEKLQVLVLSHLSHNNNIPAKVAALFSPHSGNTKIVVASRYASTDVYLVDKLPATPGDKKLQQGNRIQLSLF